MADFTKLAAYLNSFEPGDSNYDLACFVKTKLGRDLADNQTINNGGSDELEDNDVTMSTPEQQAQQNIEGDLMDGAFKELDALNQIQEQKEEIHLPGNDTNQEVASPQDFGTGAQNQKSAAKRTLFNVIQSRLIR